MELLRLNSVDIPCCCGREGAARGDHSLTHSRTHALWRSGQWDVDNETEECSVVQCIIQSGEEAVRE